VPPPLAQGRLRGARERLGKDKKGQK